MAVKWAGQSVLPYGVRYARVVDPYEELQSLRADTEEALSRHTPFQRPAVLTSWVVIAEFMDEDGKKWLSRADSEGTTQWHREGMLWDALHAGDWEPESED